MKARIFQFFLFSLIPFLLFSQYGYIGIGTNTPTGPLSFANILGNKIVLWGDGNTDHYGLGIQSGLLQLYSNGPSSDIVFGSGRSGLFNERMRIINGGGDGFILGGRMILKNGTNPLDLNYGSGIWMYKPDNSSYLGFMGVQNSQNLGFYGGPAGWGFTYDAINSRVGIGNNTPNAPLAFPPSLGKKITLYPGNTGDVGFGVTGNRLQIYSDNPNADVAIGYDAAGLFNERFAVKPNGALAIVGNTGSAGQVLGSAGAGPAKWVNGINYIYNNTIEYNQSSNSSSTNYNPIPGLSQSITLVKRSKVIVNLTGTLQSSSCFGCGSQAGEIAISINSLLPITGLSYSSIPNGDYINITTGEKVFTFDPGTYTLIAAYNNRLGDIRNITATGFRMTLIIVPEE